LTVIGAELAKQPVNVFVFLTVVVPGATPKATPEFAFIVRKLVLFEVQVKPVPPVNVTVEPTHTCDGPVITGFGFTVIVAEVFEQVVDASVNMKDVVPTATPVTTPLGEIVATAGFPPDQVPPIDGVKLIFAPTHT
jgi:hypothetical protein